MRRKDGVRDDGVASLIVAARERRGSLGVGFENMNSQRIEIAVYTGTREIAKLNTANPV